MTLSFVLDWLPFFTLIAFSGFVDAVIGGGGLISIPALIASGVSPNLILGTNKWIASSGALVSCYRYIKNTPIFWSMMAPAMVCSSLGAGLGVWLSQFLSPHGMVLILACLIPLLFMVQYRSRKVRLRPIPKFTPREQLFRILPMGLTLGIYDGFFGPGTGILLFMGMTHILKMNPLSAVAHGKLLNVTSNLTALGLFLIQGKILWPLALGGTVASMTGNGLGSFLAIRKSDKIIQPAFYAVLLLLLIKCLMDLYSRESQV